MKGRVRWSTWRIREGGLRAGDGVRRITGEKEERGECECVELDLTKYSPVIFSHYHFHNLVTNLSIELDPPL